MTDCKNCKHLAGCTATICIAPNKYKSTGCSGFEPKPDFLKHCMEGSEDMTETVHKIVADIECKFETDAIIALLRKLLLAVQNYYFGYLTFKGVQGIQVEGALECIIAAMEAELKKNEEVNKEN